MRKNSYIRQSLLSNLLNQGIIQGVSGQFEPRIFAHSFNNNGDILQKFAVELTLFFLWNVNNIMSSGRNGRHPHLNSAEVITQYYRGEGEGRAYISINKF